MKPLTYQGILQLPCMLLRYFIKLMGQKSHLEVGLGGMHGLEVSYLLLKL